MLCKKKNKLIFKKFLYAGLIINVFFNNIHISQAFSGNDSIFSDKAIGAIRNEKAPITHSSWGDLRVSFRAPIEYYGSGNERCIGTAYEQVELEHMKTPKCTASGSFTTIPGNDTYTGGTTTGSVTIDCDDGNGTKMTAVIGGESATYMAPLPHDEYAKKGYGGEQHIFDPYYNFSAHGLDTGKYIKKITVTKLTQTLNGEINCVWNMTNDFSDPVGTVNRSPYLFVELKTKPKGDDGIYKIPCDEARDFFNESAFKENNYNVRGGGESLLKMDEKSLTDDFFSAISKYNSAHPNEPAYVSESLKNNITALFWLMTEGTNYPEMVFTEPQTKQTEELLRISREIDAFKKRNPKDYMTFKTYKKLLDEKDAIYNEASLGTEPGLEKAIRSAGKKLTPGEVFGVALEQVRGDVRQALLLSHNTMRSFARGGDNPYTRVSPNPSVFKDNLAELKLKDDGSNQGSWYHLFTTSFGDIQMQGDSGPLTTTISASNALNETFGQPFFKAMKAIKGVKDNSKFRTPTFGTADTTGTSVFSNNFEQVVRSGGFDPEKYCINIWGARIGQKLYESLADSNDPIYGPMGARKPGMKDARQAKISGSNEYDPGLLTRGLKKFSGIPSSAIKKAAETQVWIEQKLPSNPLVSRVGSPVTITWEGPSGKMIFDQSTKNIYGYYPVFLFPEYEKDTDTWGVTWVDLTEEKYTITFDAVATGTLHYVIADTSTGKMATYVTPVSVGESYNIQVSPSTLPSPLLRLDGAKVDPVVETFSEPDDYINTEKLPQIKTEIEKSNFNIWPIYFVLILIFAGVFYKKYPEKTVQFIQKSWEIIKKVVNNIYNLLKIYLPKLWELMKLFLIKLYSLIIVIVQKIKGFVNSTKK